MFFGCCMFTSTSTNPTIMQNARYARFFSFDFLALLAN
jgi:hypothetical protein